MIETTTGGPCTYLRHQSLVCRHHHLSSGDMKETRHLKTKYRVNEKVNTSKINMSPLCHQLVGAEGLQNVGTANLSTDQEMGIN